MNDAMQPVDRELVIRRLARARERRHLLRWSAIGFAALVVYAWTTGDIQVADLGSPRRVANLHRFLSELRPFPLQGRSWDWTIAASWLRGVLASTGIAAGVTTLGMSIAAISLAGAAAAVLALPAARTWNTAEAYAPASRAPGVAERVAYGLCVWMVRAVLIFLRAVPEYVWTFVLLAVVGPNAWAAVLALALHNAGILAKLNAEVIENLPSEPLRALRVLGATRRQVALAAIVPSAIPRYLLFFFYRWETCLREATVLGMLGMVSIGFFIQDARTRQQYDVMLALILLSSTVVIAGDIVSAVLRRAIRNRA
jgi:phosphonate transport system permease protein